MIGKLISMLVGKSNNIIDANDDFLRKEKKKKSIRLRKKHMTRALKSGINFIMRYIHFIFDQWMVQIVTKKKKKKRKP
jgi:hypothetical protein